MDKEAKRSGKIQQRIIDHSALLLSQGDDVGQHSAVKHELHVLGGVVGCGVLPDDGEKGGLVLQISSPEGKDPLPGWGKILAFS